MERKLEKAQARRFQLLATGFLGGEASTGAVLQRLGYVQIDPLNVCGRMHDLILRNRVHNYREGALLEHLHLQRQGFEHYLPDQGILVAWPLEAWPWLLEAMQLRRSGQRGYFGRLDKDETLLAEDVLRELAHRGPLSSDAIEHEARAQTAWGSGARKVKTVLEKLFAHGRVLITARRGFRRVYDLPERVLPGSLAAANPKDQAQTRTWTVLTRLRQRRLACLKKGELSLVGDLVCRLQVPDCPTLYCLKEDLSLLESAQDDSGAGDGRCHLVAPLDPLIYDRRLCSLLWDFNYTWEVYTPAAKRQRGYYALPVLKHLTFGGHVEPRIDRTTGRLSLLSRQLKQGFAASRALEELRRFLCQN